MNFLNIEIFWHLLWLLPLLAFLIIWAVHKRRQALRSLLGIHADDPDFVLVSRGIRVLRLVLFIAALLCLVLAAARPYWGVHIIPSSAKGRDIMVVFDTSRSMLAQDVQPSRLDHAKWYIRKLVGDCPGDRFGLIAILPVLLILNVR